MRYYVLQVDWCNVVKSHGVVVGGCPDNQALLEKLASKLEIEYKKFKDEMDLTILCLTAMVQAKEQGTCISIYEYSPY